jgi:hypothetical protein
MTREKRIDERMHSYFNPCFYMKRIVVNCSALKVFVQFPDDVSQFLWDDVMSDGACFPCVWTCPPLPDVK